MSDANTFSAAQVVNKTLVAAKKVNIYRDATDMAQPIGFVAAGQPIGVVDSWLDANPLWGRSGLWWVFYSPSTSYYYVPHIGGNFSISNLKEQGAITVQEQTDIEKAKQEALDNEGLPWYEVLVKKYGAYVLGAAVAVKIVPPLVQGMMSNRK